MTRTDAVIGTPAYIAPERLRRSPTPDERADVYSLAVVLYECLVGKPPYGGEALAVLAGHLDPKPPPMPDSVPPPMRSVLRRGLAPDPDDRYQTAEEFGAAVEDAARRCDQPERSPSTGARTAVGVGVGALLALLVTVALGLSDSWLAAGLIVGAGALLGYAFVPRPATPPPVSGQPTIGVPPGGLPQRRS